MARFKLPEARSPRAFEKSDAGFDVHARAGGVTEINLYDEIGYYGVTAKMFRQALDGITTPVIRLNINSPGGDVFDALAIFSDLLDHDAEVDVRVTGLAASAASIIAMAGDKISIAGNAFFMIHNAWSVAVGDHREMAARAKLLAKIDVEMAKTYAKRTDLDAEDVAEMMNAETWLSADEAVANGFADALIDDDETADASAKFELSIFKNVPRALKPSKRSAKAKAATKPAIAPAPTENLLPSLAALDKLCKSMAA